MFMLISMIELKIIINQNLNLSQIVLNRLCQWIGGRGGEGKRREGYDIYYFFCLISDGGSFPLFFN